MDIREYLENNRLITDGGMGTYYDQLTGFRGKVSERGNTDQAELVVRIHKEYIRAGAQLIRSNTFAVNSMFFASEEQIREYIAAGWENAVCAVNDSGRENVWAAADMGPIYESEERSREAVLAEYRMITDVFLEGGAKIFVFETLSDFSCIGETAAHIRKHCPEAFIIAQFSLNKDGMTKSGISAGRLLEEAAAQTDVDAVGFNCGVGPNHLFKILESLALPKGKFITALPNAGYPMELRGRTIYSENVPYYVEMAGKIASLGIDIVGGCCGTTPEHIRGIAGLLRDGIKPPKKLMKKMPASYVKDGSMRKTAFMEKLEQGELVYAVELDPPFDGQDEKMMKGALVLKEAEADMVTLADSPLARPRADSVACAVRMQYKTGMPVMPHISCRDKNAIAMRAQFLGMHMNEIRHTLLVTGDPIPRGDRDSIKSVFNFNSIKLMQYLKVMNEEMFADSPVYYGGALNQNAGNADMIIRRMKQKMEAGASYFLTQPVYSQEDIDRLRYMRERTGARILAGVMPLVSRKNALFIKNEMPGIIVPDEVLDLYREGLTRADYEQIAADCCLDVMRRLKGCCDGYYMMTPFNRTSLITGIIRQAKEEL